MKKIRQLLDRWLGKWGYVHESQLTDEYLLLQVSKMVGDPTEYEIDKKAEDEMFGDLSAVHGYSQYLTATMARDMQRYFAAPKEQQDVIHGAFARAAYLKSRLTKEKDKQIDNKTKMNGLRYAK